jgi:hypothetical protein
MGMKRRNFLAMMGAAAATPALPGGVPSLAPKLKALGVAHAKKFPFVSRMGMSKRLKISDDQAQELLGYLNRQGIVGPLNSSATGLSSGPSRTFRPAPVKTSMAEAQRAKAKAAREKALEAKAQRHSDLMAYLRVLCVEHGVELHPRVMAMAA